MRKSLYVLFLFWLPLMLLAQNNTLLRSGPMVGYSTLREVKLWVQTTQSARVQIRYWDEKKPDEKKTTPVVQTDSEMSFIAHIPINYLEPSTKYGYELLLNGMKVSRPYPLRFQTQVLWQFRTEAQVPMPEFSIAIGSCNYINETKYDRPGAPYGNDPKVFSQIAKQNPDAMLWLGDNTYYREVDYDNVSMMDHRNAHTRQTKEMQPVFGGMHNYAIWDDHDYGPNDSDRGFIFKYEALDLFNRYWANPASGFKDAPGAYYTFNWGDAQFFMLDNRFHRSPNREPDSPEKTVLGAAQRQWLLDALTTSQATFKIIAIGGQTVNDIAVFENLATFPTERKMILDEIIKRKIEGVVFLSGDRHHTELLKWQPQGFYPLYDFTSSPLTSAAGNPEREGSLEKGNALRVANTLVTTQNFGILRFAGQRGARTLTMETIDSDGNIKWKHVIKANDLKVPQ